LLSSIAYCPQVPCPTSNKKAPARRSATDESLSFVVPPCFAHSSQEYALWGPGQRTHALYWAHPSRLRRLYFVTMAGEVFTIHRLSISGFIALLYIPSP